MTHISPIWLETQATDEQDPSQGRSRRRRYRRGALRGGKSPHFKWGVS